MHIVLALVLLFKLKREVINFEALKSDLSQMNKVVSSIKTPAADSEINLQTLVFSKLIKYLFTNYIRFSLPG